MTRPSGRCSSSRTSGRSSALDHSPSVKGADGLGDPRGETGIVQQQGQIRLHGFPPGQFTNALEQEGS